MLYHVHSSLDLVVVYKVAMRTEPLASVIHLVAPPGIERAEHQHPTLGGSTDIGSNVGEDVSARRSKHVSRLYIGPAGVQMMKEIKRTSGIRPSGTHRQATCPLKR